MPSPLICRCGLCLFSYSGLTSFWHMKGLCSDEEGPTFFDKYYYAYGVKNRMPYFRKV